LIVWQDDRAERYASVEAVLEDFFKSDASKSFTESQGANFLLDNPLSRLVFKTAEPAETPDTAEPEEESESETTEQHRTTAVVSPSSAGLLGVSSAGLPSGPIARSITGPIAPLGSNPAVPAPAEEGLARDFMQDGGDLDADMESGERGRRPRAQRPYSFQQRLKEREK
jgi:hypothetical protein